jgi:hypothetical protein
MLHNSKDIDVTERRSIGWHTICSSSCVSLKREPPGLAMEDENGDKQKIHKVSNEEARKETNNEGAALCPSVGGTKGALQLDRN